MTVRNRHLLKYCTVFKYLPKNDLREMIIDIVLLPPEAVCEKIGKFVRKLSKRYKLQMAVDNRKLLPHISLLHIKTSAKRVSAIASIIRAISGRFSEQALKFTKPKIARDYFVMDLGKTKKLMELHREVVFSAHKFKIGFSGVGNSKDDKLQREYIQKYGAGNILKNFSPHITLGIVKWQKDLLDIASALFKQRWPAFSSKRLAITQVNNRHQVFRVLKEFKLK